MLEGTNNLYSLWVIYYPTTKQKRMIKLHSLMKTYNISSGTMRHDIIVTAIRMVNDINGNPRYKAQVWTNSNDGHVWTPKVAGYKRITKSDSYILESVYNLPEDMDFFVWSFEKSVSE